MRPRVSGAASVLLLMSAGFLTPINAPQALAEAIPAPGPDGSSARDLQLEVYVNGDSTELIASFHEDEDGTLVIEPEQLSNVGLDPAETAVRPDGLVDIAQLPGVSYTYDEAAQSIHFEVAFDALSTRIIRAHKNVSEEEATGAAKSSFGALMNYTVYASTGGDDIDDMWSFEGVSGWLEGRVFGPFGVISHSHLARSSTNDRYGSTRLDTNWSYSSRNWMTTFRAGDVITGGLSWTRPTRLGGLQIQRNFGLRPDLVTMPLPELSGSAAVPSTVDVYLNNARHVSEGVPAGPFRISDLPVVTGGGTARVVVRDALGRETVTETPFFASSQLLAPGLWDYSMEAGFARRFYGIESNDYDSRLMASGTFRYGLSDWLTLEGHAEGGGGLINGGAGAVFGLGPYGVGTLAVSASSYNGASGFQVAGSMELEYSGVHFFARSQRTFGDYSDIAAITAQPFPASLPGAGFIGAAPPRTINQVSLSVPMKIDPTSLSFSYTELKTVEGDKSRLLGLSLNRPFGTSASLFATAFTDLENENSFGVFVGLSMPFGRDVHASTGVSTDGQGTAVTTTLTKSEGAGIGGYGWRLRDTEGDRTNRAASASYRSRFARVEAGIEQHGDHFRSFGQIDGAVVAAGGGVFLSNRIDDAFAVVDTGAAGVDVEYENRPIGRTDRGGRLLIPVLRSYEPNKITIDPANLPVDATVGNTMEVVVPADRSGAVVRFGVDTDPRAALVTLRDEQGAFLETGSRGRLDGQSEDFVVGYDGQAFVAGLGSHNRIVIDQASRGRCAAEFDFEPRPGVQITIPDVTCRAIR
ncbi:fimbria/pilus outer membrane usher protein [Nitratireductor sp. ZSWI3]|uniref:fimbria/pilus outer membrane usher protein n=1 Tax=Nitratireductor sp. ZSWI3 TaxID=2966359 RepID=UPI00214F6696|nr:fimbria/pilus outer membrane usher protein [Nitratireductor sp. ZSWI3]MCR4265402.1 fimbria/pilus outer membrane usher protein [Nitratireductor sp. ZSWI3]